MIRLFFLLAALSRLVTAATLPAAEGETLAGIKLVIPSALAGKTALLIIGFTKDSQKQTEAWAKRIKADAPGLDALSVADLEGAPRLIRPMILKAMRSSTPKPQHDHFLILTRGGKGLRSALNYDARKPQEDDAYLVLLGSDGEIRWQSHGGVSDAAMKNLRDQLK